MFIRDRFAATAQQITEDAINYILSITDGHPHDTQELCYFTWAIAAGERAEATPALVDRALEQVLDAEDAHFTTLWESLSVHQRLVLAALVASGEAVYSEAYRRQHRLGAASNVQRSVERLVQRDLVELVSPGSYQLTDVFLRAWIVRLVAPNGGRPPAALE